MSYKIKWCSEMVYVQYSSHCTLNESIEAIGSLVGNSRFDSMSCQLVDLTDVRKFDLNNNDVPILASLTKLPSNWNKKMKFIFVSCDDEITAFVDQYIGRMKQFNIDMIRINSLKEAKELLRNLLNKKREV